MADELLIDPSVIDSLRELGESTQEPLLAELSRIFLETAPKTLSHLRSGLGSNDRDEVVKAAHSLKSSSSALGLLRIQRLASAIEASARGGELAKARTLLAELDQVWEPSRRALIAYSPGVE